MHATVARDKHYFGAAGASRGVASFHNGYGHAPVYGPSIPAGLPRTMLYPPPRGSPAASPPFTFQPPPLAPMHPAWRGPPGTFSAPFPTYAMGMHAAPPPPTLPPIRALVGTGKPEGCARPPSGRPFFPPTPVKRVPQGAMVTTGPRWLTDPELNIAWCILPPPAWPTRARTPAAQGSCSDGDQQEDHFPGASQPEAAEQARPSPMSISALLRSDSSSYDSLSASSGSPPSLRFSSPLTTPPSSPESAMERPLAQEKDDPPSPRGGQSSDVDEPLVGVPRTRVQLPGIAALNLPTLKPKNIPSRAAVRPVAGRRPRIKSSESESEAGMQSLGGARSPSYTSSALSSPEVEVDELEDDDDEYKPPSASSSKRKAGAARHDSAPPKKKGPGPPATRRHECDECPQVFYYDSHYNKHKVAHAKKKGKNSKPFHCRRCNQGFGRIWDLERHLFTHTGKKPFQCRYCTRGYNRNDALLRHLRQGKPGHPKALPKKR